MWHPHYEGEGPNAGWRTGYEQWGHGHEVRTLSLDRLVWRRMPRYWDVASVVCPSSWLAQSARESALMRKWPVHVIPNALNVNLFTPRNRSQARAALGLPGDASVILAGAPSASEAHPKGCDLLCAALRLLELDDGIIVLFGRGEPAPGMPWASRVRAMGPIENDEVLALLLQRGGCRDRALPTGSVWTSCVRVTCLRCAGEWLCDRGDSRRRRPRPGPRRMQLA